MLLPQAQAFSWELGTVTACLNATAHRGHPKDSSRGSEQSDSDPAARSAGSPQPLARSPRAERNTPRGCRKAAAACPPAARAPRCSHQEAAGTGALIDGAHQRPQHHAVRRGHGPLPTPPPPPPPPQHLGAGNGRARSTPPPRCHRRVAAGVKPAGRGGGRCRAQCQGAANQRPGRGGGGEERAGLRGQEMGQRQEGRVRGWLGGVCHVMSGARLLPTAAVGWAGGAEAVREGGAQGCAGAGRASERVPVSLATRESRSEEESGGKR